MLFSDPDSTSVEYSEVEPPAAAVCSNNLNSQQGSVASGLKKIAEWYTAGMYPLNRLWLRFDCSLTLQVTNLFLTADNRYTFYYFVFTRTK